VLHVYYIMSFMIIICGNIIIYICSETQQKQHFERPSISLPHSVVHAHVVRTYYLENTTCYNDSSATIYFEEVVMQRQEDVLAL
jgi:hypothetical protein